MIVDACIALNTSLEKMREPRRSGLDYGRTGLKR